jgi:hypothetical protein
MGTAAYNRGSKSVVRGIRADLEKRAPSLLPPQITGAEPLSWSDERARLQADLMNAQAEITRLRAEVEAHRAYADDADGRAEHAHKLAAQHFRASNLAMRRLNWAWKVIRAYVSPGLVQEFRSEVPEPSEDPS